MQSYQYEMIRKPEVKEGLLLKAAVQLAAGTILPESGDAPVPTRESILYRHREAVSEAGGPQNVEVNIRPFCRA